MLVAAGGTQALINRAVEQNHGLGIFIRSLVGLEREAAKQALNEFINGSTVTANQIEFINTIIEGLIQKGVMAVDRLYESPFVDIHPQGPEGVFPAATLHKLMDALDDIKQKAVA